MSTSAYIQYTTSKLAVENLVVDFGVPYMIVRPDVIYSSDEPKIVEQQTFMKKGIAICIGNGKSLRTPTHVLDLSLIFDKAIRNNQFLNRVYEVGSPVPCSQIEFIRTIARANGYRPLMLHIPCFLVYLQYLSKFI